MKNPTMNPNKIHLKPNRIRMKLEAINVNFMQPTKAFHITTKE